MTDTMAHRAYLSSSPSKVPRLIPCGSTIRVGVTEVKFCPFAKGGTLRPKEIKRLLAKDTQGSQP